MTTFTKHDLKEWASTIADLRAWTYTITLTYRDGLYGTQSTTERQLKEWASRVQHLYGGRFEYLFFPEHMEYGGRFDHLHGLLFVSTLHKTDLTNDKAIRDAIDSEWRYGFARVTRAGKTPKAKVGAASYILKDYSASKPFFQSPSLARPLPDVVMSPPRRRTLAEQLAARSAAQPVA